MEVFKLAKKLRTSTFFLGTRVPRHSVEMGVHHTGRPEVRLIKCLYSYCSACVSFVQSNQTTIRTQTMLATNVKAESYIHEFKGRVQPSMLI